jgi:hypothetical protein
MSTAFAVDAETNAAKRKDATTNRFIAISQRRYR